MTLFCFLPIIMKEAIGNRRKGCRVVSNEEKILQMLDEMKADMNALKAEMETLKQHSVDSKKSVSQRQQKEAIRRMSQILTADEKQSFGRFMDAEEARKAAVYGC